MRSLRVLSLQSLIVLSLVALSLIACLGASGASTLLAGDALRPFEILTSFKTMQVDFSGLEKGQTIKVTLAGGRGEIQGVVLEVDGFTIRIKHKFGVQEIRKEDVVRWERFRTTAEQYEDRAKLCKTADDWCDLGDWAANENDEKLALRAYREATRVDPDHARARKALNEELVDGEWLPFDEAQRAKGLEYYDGAWRTPEEIAEIEKKEQEETTSEKLQGREQLAMEYAGRPWAEMDPIETQHYVIHCNSTEEIAEYYADVMEALYKKYDSVFPEKYFPRNSRKKSTVWIHANHQQFMDWTFNGPGTGGFYRPALRDVTAYHGSFGTTGSTEEVLAHEGTHQFQGLIFENMFALPAWFIEGMAVYFGDGSKISRRKVEINEIPRDRLVGLQQAIEDGTYCTLRQLLRIPQPQFGGFFYGHGWGVIYWCLWGEKMGAGNKGVGRPLMDDWLLHCKRESKKDGWCELEENANVFEKLLTQHTGKSVDEWEEEYKQWILGLPVEQIGKKRGNKWSSEPLKLEITKPAGWNWVKETDLSSDEVVAAKAGGRQTRRVSTYCWANWQHSEMSEEYATRLVNNIFQGIDVGPDFKKETIGGYPDAYRASFKAKRVLKAESSVDENGQPKMNVEVGDELQYEVVFYGSIDKIYANVFECEPEIWDANYKHMEKYLEDFHIDN